MTSMASGPRERFHGITALSPRERIVLEMVASGLTNVEIAHKLGVSVHAIKFHLASVYRKLGVGNRTEAAIRFVRDVVPMSQDSA
jgi:DNA-binding CsgD family transcriptional regulator